jgi:hypothetical protein
VKELQDIEDIDLLAFERAGALRSTVVQYRVTFPIGRSWQRHATNHRARRIEAGAPDHLTNAIRVQADRHGAIAQIQGTVTVRNRNPESAPCASGEHPVAQRRRRDAEVPPRRFVACIQVDRPLIAKGGFRPFTLVLVQESKVVPRGRPPWRGGYCLNDGMPLAELLQSSGAICAAGPSRFIAAYQSALAKNGTDAYTPWERSPKVWRDGSWQEESHSTSLLLLKPHFIVGTGFSARRIA